MRVEAKPNKLAKQKPRRAAQQGCFDFVRCDSPQDFSEDCGQGQRFVKNIPEYSWDADYGKLSSSEGESLTDCLFSPFIADTRVAQYSPNHTKSLRCSQTPDVIHISRTESADLQAKSTDRMYFLPEDGDGVLRSLSIGASSNNGSASDIPTYFSTSEAKEIASQGTGVIQEHRIGTVSSESNIQTVIDVSGASSPLHSEGEQYANDFESEDEEVSFKATSESNVCTQSHFGSTSPSESEKDEAARSNQNVTKLAKKIIERNNVKTQVPQIPSHESKATQRSVHVQTSSIGSIPASNPLSHNQSSFPISPSLTTFRMTEMICQPNVATQSTLGEYMLNAPTGYNPLVLALDNILRQQLNITRQFLSAQNSLHRVFTEAINHCITTEYCTWTNTKELIRSMGP